METIAHRRQNILNRIKEASMASLLKGKEPRLMAVSKTQPVDEIEKAIIAGQLLFGENRVQEAIKKWPALREKYNNIELHLIGPLQTNKVKESTQIFDVIETVDRPKLAEALAAAENKPKLYMQINIGEEPQKAGVLPQDASALLKLMRDLNLPVAGVMCIPPVDKPPEPHFAWLYNFARQNNLQEISMGMSHDFEAAVRFGATMVRVGTALFGERN